MNAVYQYSIDNNNLPSGITTTLSNVVSTATTNTCAITGFPTGATLPALAGNVSDFVGAIAPTYIASIPRDPQAGTAGCSDYLIQSGTGDRITVSAPRAELSGVSISVER